MRAKYQVQEKKFFQDFCEELNYIKICLWESLNILGSHYKKKIFQDNNGL